MPWLPLLLPAAGAVQCCRTGPMLTRSFLPRDFSTMTPQILEGFLDRLSSHRRAGAPQSIRRLFLEDPDRHARFSATLGDVHLDWSKCAVGHDTMRLLFELAEAAAVARKRDAMFSGAIINAAEHRPALHIALRNRSNRPIFVNGGDVMPEVNAVLARMRHFSEALRSRA